MSKNVLIEKASDEIKEEFNKKIQELELQRKKVEDDLKDLEVRRLKKTYENKRFNLLDKLLSFVKENPSYIIGFFVFCFMMSAFITALTMPLLEGRFAIICLIAWGSCAVNTVLICLACSWGCNVNKRRRMIELSDCGDATNKDTPENKNNIMMS